MTVRTGREAATFTDYGLSCFTYSPEQGTGWRGAGTAEPPHTHLELEMMLVETGWATLDIAGRDERVGAGELVAFWGGLPHGVTDADLGVVAHVAQMPFVDVLSWIGSTDTIDHLLQGRVLRSSAEASTNAMDGFAFGRWTADLVRGSVARRAAVELEMQARLHRLVDEILRGSTSAQSSQPATAEVAAAAIRFVVRHFMEDITVDDIARAVGRNHDHVMQCFRRACGVSLWEYVTRVRVGEARRLLLATNLPILTVCHRAGFSSISRMYDVFNRYCGQTPGQCRTHSARHARSQDPLGHGGQGGLG
jgi:AraC-like DNA-binding protein